MTFVWIISSTMLVSLIAFVGVFTFGIKEALLKKVLFSLIGFSAGALIGGAFLHLLPEAVDKAPGSNPFYYLVLGIVAFFFLERYFHWRHCHEEVCQTHAFTYLNLVGDGLHNFIDGIVIAVSFLTSVHLGIVTTLAIIFHEIPQEFGDYAVLVYGGFSRKKALLFNFLSALTAVVGACVGYLFAGLALKWCGFILAFTAGGFVYIATSDLIPEIHKEKDLMRSTLAFIAFLVGLAFMAIAKLFLGA